MRSPPLPSALRSTVAERQSALERAVENAVAAAQQLDEARYQIGMPPAEPLFILANRLGEIVDERVAAIEAERAAAAKAKLSPYQLDKLAREEAKAKAGPDLPPFNISPEEYARAVQYTRDVEAEIERRAAAAKDDTEAIDRALVERLEQGGQLQ